MNKRPFEMLAGHCKITIDGNQWCIMYGEDPQNGVVGYGDSPEEASRNFDAAWFADLEQGE